MRKILIISLLVLIVEFGQQTAGLSNPILSDIQDIKSWAHDVGDIASGDSPLSGLSTGEKDSVQAKLDELSKQIEELSTSFNFQLDNELSQILTNMSEETDFRVRMNQLDSFMARISDLFKDYERISKSSSKSDQSSTDQFVEAATSMKDGDVIETLNQMHRLYTGSEDDDTHGSLVSVAASVFASMDPSSLCGQATSRQQRVYDLYRMVVITEIKGFLMTAYAYGMLGIYRNSKFSEEIRGAEENLITRISDYLSVTKEDLVSVPRDVYVCDPEHHSSGKTFVDLSRAVQLIMMHEEQLEDCDTSCYKLFIQRYYNNNIQSKNQPKTVCEGTTFECQNIYENDICEIESDIEDSVGRLVYIKSSKLGEFGDSDRCVNASKTHQRVWVRGYYECVPCLCTCIELRSSSTAIRGFSLRPQVTDIENNMVLTGISFEKRDNLIQLQIEQGKLIADGRIEEGSEELVPLEKFEYDPKKRWAGGFDIWVNGKKQDAVKKEDYIFIDVYERQIHLDDIVAVSTGYVVTGARLIANTLDSDAITLSIRLTMFNYTSGKLSLEKNPSGMDNGEATVDSIWVDGDAAAKQKGLGARTFIDVEDKIEPSKSYNNVPSSKDHSEIMITHSSTRDDVGQSTIPYFDKIMSGPMPRVALDGLGLYHRSNGESGGFIGIKTFTYDLSKYLNP